MRTRFGLWSILLLALGVASTSGAQVLPTSSGPRASDSSARAAEPAGRVVGTVIDEYNAISLPGVPVENLDPLSNAIEREPKIGPPHDPARPCCQSR